MEEGRRREVESEKGVAGANKSFIYLTKIAPLIERKSAGKQNNEKEERRVIKMPKVTREQRPEFQTAKRRRKTSRFLLFNKRQKSSQMNSNEPLFCVGIVHGTL